MPPARRGRRAGYPLRLEPLLPRLLSLAVGLAVGLALAGAVAQGAYVASTMRRV